jgi:hypothetical protein
MPLLVLPQLSGSLRTFYLFHQAGQEPIRHIQAAPIPSAQDLLLTIPATAGTAQLCLCGVCRENETTPCPPSAKHGIKFFWMKNDLVKEAFCFLTNGIMHGSLTPCNIILDFYFYLFIYFAVLGFELRASRLLDRRSTTWATPPALDFYFFLHSDVYSCL